MKQQILVENEQKSPILEPEEPSVRIIRLPEVMITVGLCRSEIYLLMEKGAFPKQVQLGGRSVGWVYQEIQQWLRNKIAAR